MKNNKCIKIFYDIKNPPQIHKPILIRFKRWFIDKTGYAALKDNGYEIGVYNGVSYVNMCGYPIENRDDCYGISGWIYLTELDNIPTKKHSK